MGREGFLFGFPFSVLFWKQNCLSLDLLKGLICLKCCLGGGEVCLILKYKTFEKIQVVLYHVRSHFLMNLFGFSSDINGETNN